MKTLFAIFILLMISSCAKEIKIENDAISYYYLSFGRNRMTVDTVKYKEANYIDSLDELLASESFEYQNKWHVIKMYSSDNQVPVDAGELKYTLDSIGIIYKRAIWWPNFIRLSSKLISIF